MPRLSGIQCLTHPAWTTAKSAWDWYLEATAIIDSEREREVVENSDTILIFVRHSRVRMFHLTPP